jgi:hypothetical protein
MARSQLRHVRPNSMAKKNNILAIHVAELTLDSYA